MATINAINNTSETMSTTALTVEPGSAADSPIYFNINATSEFTFGADQSASNALTLSQGGTLGTTNTFVMTSNGEVRMALNPSAFETNNGFPANVTGDGTTFTLGNSSSLTEVYDQGGDFTTATFTAPVTGLYYISLFVILEQPSSSCGTNLQNSIVTSNRTYQIVDMPQRGRVANLFAGNNGMSSDGQAFADMDSADTCTVTVRSSGGSKVQDLQNLCLSFYLAC